MPELGKPDRWKLYKLSKIGEVQRNLDSSENLICSRVWATYTYTKKSKEAD
jgi:hypothetical protein